MTHTDFTVAADFDRGLFWKRGRSVRYLVARVNAGRTSDRTGGHTAVERHPLNIALVIDASGSMANGKLDAAKEAALGLAERLTARDRLTVVSFASDIVTHLDAVPVTEKNAVRIQNEIMALHTRGMTCLSGGWFAGVECAARVAEEDAKMTARVIILSDGHANEGITGPDELREHAGELRQRGVLTSTLGIGNGYDEHLLRAVAESGGGRLHDAELATEIRTVLLGELEDILETLVENVQVTLKSPRSVAVEPIGLRATQASGQRTVVSLGPVQGGVERFAIFKVTCPKAPTGKQLAFEVSAEGRGADDGSALSVRAGAVALTSARGRANNAQARNKNAARLVARAWSADIVSRASRMNRGGDFRKAERHVRTQLTYFVRYVESLGIAHEMIESIESLQMLAERVSYSLSARMSKEMTYESALMMGARKDRRARARQAAMESSWKERIARGE